MKDRVPDGHKWCSACEEILPEDQFLNIRNTTVRVRVTFCNKCASRNMRAWAASKNVGMRPEDIVAIDD
jgi:hypothetical protein